MNGTTAKKGSVVFWISDVQGSLTFFEMNNLSVHNRFYYYFSWIMTNKNQLTLVYDGKSASRYTGRFFSEPFINL